MSIQYHSYCPRTKKELLVYMSRKYPNEKKSKFLKMGINQLKAIFYKNKELANNRWANQI